MSLGVGKDSEAAQCAAFRNPVGLWSQHIAYPVLVLKCAGGGNAVSTGCLMSPSGLAWRPAWLAVWLDMPAAEPAGAKQRARGRGRVYCKPERPLLYTA